MRIAYLIGVFPPPAETPVLNQITGLLDRGHEVDVFADVRSSAPEYHPDVDRYRLLDRARFTPERPRSLRARAARAMELYRGAPAGGRSPLLRSLNVLAFSSHASKLRLFYQAAPFLDRGPYDIINCGHGHDGRKALRLRRIGAVGGRLVTAFRGRDISQYVRNRGPRLYRALFREGELFLPVCEAFARRLLRLGAPPDRVVVHPTGIDLRQWTFRPRQPQPGGPLRIVTVARLVEKKGIEYVLRAVRRLVDRGIPVQYEVAGDGPLRAHLQGVLAGLGLEDRARLLGWRTPAQVREALDRAHVLVAASVTAGNADEEGIPNVLKEGMAAGLPVIGTLHSGIPELIENGVSGFLVPERDVEALAERLAHLARHPEQWPALAWAGRRRVERDYEIGRLNDRLVALFERLLAPA